MSDRSSKYLKKLFRLSEISFFLLIGLVLSYQNLDQTGYLKVLKGNPILVEKSSAVEDSLGVLEEYQITTDKNIRIQLAVRKPGGISDKLPVIIILGGMEVGKNSLRYITHPGQNILVALDYPYRPKYWYQKKDFYYDLWIIRRALIQMVPNVLNVLDFLYTRPEVDTSRISLAGYSFGAPFVPVLMKLDPRFKCAVIAYGGGNIGGMLSDNLKTGTGATDWLLGHILGVLLTEIEPTKYVGSIPPRPVLYINGYQDNLIRPERARLLHAKAPEPKDIIWLESRHMDPGKPEVTKLIVETSVQWLQKKGLIN